MIRSIRGVAAVVLTALAAALMLVSLPKQSFLLVRRELATTEQQAAAQSVLQAQAYHNAHHEVVKLRGLFFGTSRTWGSGLEFIGRDKAYPYKTVFNATNLAIRSTGPSYPAKCLKSMIGDDARFDFVVFEFYHILWGGEAKLYELARRVRTRFPDATLIFLMIPLPGNIVHIPSRKGLSEMLGLKGGVYAPISKDEIDKVLLGTSPEEWSLDQQKKQREHLLHATLAVGGHLWTPIPAAEDKLTFDHIRKLSSLFFKDGNHYNVNGHDFIANSLRNLLVVKNAKHSNRVNEWDSYDACSEWFQTGKINLLYNNMKQYSWSVHPGIGEMDVFNGKHALEVAPRASWIKISNPTTKLLNLYLYYMGTAPTAKYPKVNITLIDPINKTIELEQQIDPLLVLHMRAASEYHLVKGSYLGKVAPGEHFLFMKPAEEKERPFRLTGIALTEQGGHTDQNMEGLF